MNTLTIRFENLDPAMMEKVWKTVINKSRTVLKVDIQEVNEIVINAEEVQDETLAEFAHEILGTSLAFYARKAVDKALADKEAKRKEQGIDNVTIAPFVPAMTATIKNP